MPRRDRVAAIDCGTNSIRLLVADIADEMASEVVREMRIVRLGQDVDATGSLSDAAIDRTLQATREYAELITMLGAERVRFCATSAARDAENADDFAAAVEYVLGVRPQVLTGKEEALASFVGATRGLDIIGRSWSTSGAARPSSWSGRGGRRVVDVARHRRRPAHRTLPARVIRRGWPRSPVP